MKMILAFWLVIIWCLIDSNIVMSDIIDCSATNQCQSNFIHCLPNEDCFVYCTEIQACMDSIIECPINGSCTIECRGGQSCQAAVINATLQSSGNFNLSCLDSTDHCKDIKVYGSTVNTDINHDFNVLCDGKVRSCTSAEIICPLNSNCSISCNADTSCRWSQITGPTNGNLVVNCNGIKSCFDAIFNGTECITSMLEINGCTAYESCFDITIYCPPNSNGSKNCLLEGNDNLGKHNAGGTRIYAINGWNDININYTGNYGTFHEGKMYCGDDYDISCDIAYDSWSCINPMYCNFNFDVNIPSINISFTYNNTTTLTPNSEIITTNSNLIRQTDHDTNFDTNHTILKSAENLDREENVKFEFSFTLWMITIAVVVVVLTICCSIIGFLCCLYSKKNKQVKMYKIEKSKDITGDTCNNNDMYGGYQDSTMDIDDSFQFELGVTSVSIKKDESVNCVEPLKFRKRSSRSQHSFGNVLKAIHNGSNLTINTSNPSKSIRTSLDIPRDRDRSSVYSNDTNASSNASIINYINSTNKLNISDADIYAIPLPKLPQETDCLFCSSTGESGDSDCDDTDNDMYASYPKTITPTGNFGKTPIGCHRQTK